MAKAVEPQAIEALQQRHRKLEREKIQAERDLQNLERQVEEAREEARRLFGTDDLEALRAMLRQMNEDNLKRRKDYQQHLDEIEARLGAAEQAHAEAARPA